ncbi:bactofilin family protein [Halorussus ruber]|uniref:polymer-forming cytoskeletal protein n=1 Tax=Halorussus ruber TaxID=1126238 RepID=UPI001B2FEFE2|nr:polymer-forming cytoskeletal protein [Halorussus ruber]
MNSVLKQLVAVSLVFLLVVSTTAGVAAADPRAGGTVVGAEGETITGGLEAFGGTVVVYGTVGGDLTYDGKLSLAEGATVSGAVTRDNLGTGPVVFERPLAGSGAFDLYGFVVSLAAAAALLVVFPRFSRGVATRATESPLRTGGVGLLALVAVPVALVLLAITIVGIPLSVIGAVLFGLAAWAGALYGRFAVGSWLAELADVNNQWVALVAGFVAVALVVRVPILGGLVDLAVFLLGLGALALSLRSAYRGSRPETFEGGEGESEEVDDSGVRPA